MKFSITNKATVAFVSTVALTILLSSCRTIPSDPNQMSCEDLNYLASESVKKNNHPFFVSQLTHPGDWRSYSSTDTQIDWIKNDSRKRLRIGKQDWVEAEALRLNTVDGTQEHMKVRALFEQCKNPSHNSLQLTFITQHHKEKPNKTTQKVDLNGTTANDLLARLVCGKEDYPAKDKDEVMAQKWKECQMPAANTPK